MVATIGRLIHTKRLPANNQQLSNNIEQHIWLKTYDTETQAEQ